MAAEKGSLEEGRRRVEARRKQEGREPVAWDPSNEAMSKAWAALDSAASAYEQAPDLLCVTLRGAEWWGQGKGTDGVRRERGDWGESQC